MLSFTPNRELKKKTVYFVGNTYSEIECDEVDLNGETEIECRR